MIWVAWRQQRTASFVVLGVLVLSGIFLLVTFAVRSELCL
jgi:hypothetical protein